LFNEQIEPERTIDRHSLFDVEYARSVGESRVVLHGAYDRFTSNGYFPYDGSPFARVAVGYFDVAGSWITVGGRVTRPLPWQTLTLGAEYIDNVEQKHVTGYVGDDVPQSSLDTSSARRAVYVQDEIKLGRHVIVNGGLRYDGYERFNRVTPRTALIVMPTPHQSLKYLYGRAFRAPNIYETIELYFGPGVAALRPESIDTHEFVWERYTSDWLRTSVSSYWYKANRLITLTESNDPLAALGVTYVNEGEVRAKGLELEAQMRLWGDAEGHLSYALQEARDEATGDILTNSPRQMLKGRVSAPILGTGSSVALEVLGIGRRQTIAGNQLSATGTANVTITKSLGRSFELLGTVRNLFDAEYAIPASDSHLQDSILQNGRTFRIGLRVKVR
jgi:iron complex outermembrane receptor protein